MLSPNAHGLVQVRQRCTRAERDAAIHDIDRQLGPLVRQVFVHLGRNPAFAITSDGCSGTLLTPTAPTCQVGVTFTPSARQRRSFAVSAVFGNHGLDPATGLGRTAGSSPRSFSWTATRPEGTRVGGSGPASLQLSPGTASGSNTFSYSFGQIRRRFPDVRADQRRRSGVASARTERLDLRRLRALQRQLHGQRARSRAPAARSPRPGRATTTRLRRAWRAGLAERRPSTRPTLRPTTPTSACRRSAARPRGTLCRARRSLSSAPAPGLAAGHRR